MNGVAGSRRASRPIRLTLCETLGGVIDGAWWPHSGSIAAELPDLVGALCGCHVDPIPETEHGIIHRLALDAEGNLLSRSVERY